MNRIIRNSLLDLPICDYSNSYKWDLKQKLTNYYRYIKQKRLEVEDLSKININIIKGINLLIFEAVEEYLNGYPSKAFFHIDKLLTKYQNKLIIKMNSTKELEMLFRMRLGSNYAYTKEDLFHINFEFLHKVSSQRYSIAGFPCLYLGTTIFVCWDELGRPNLSDTHISRYKSIKDVNILDFGYRPCDIANMLERDLVDKDKFFNEILIPYLYTWPLIAASSYKVRYDNDSFKPEYIIPQLILQSIRSNEIYDGVRYFSVKGSVDNTNSFYVNDSVYIRNYVFPAKKHSEKGYCFGLADKFELTDPVQWDTVHLSGYNGFNKYGKYWDLCSQIREPQGKIVGIFGNVQCEYESTLFGKVEAFLVENMNTTKLL